MTKASVFKIPVAPPSLSAVLRYLKTPRGDRSVEERIRIAADYLSRYAKGSVCAIQVPITVQKEQVIAATLRLESTALANHLKGCKTAVIFAATLGVEADRYLQRTGIRSQADALIVDACATAMIEEVCNAFCASLKERLPPFAQGHYAIRPRFSPGYGGLGLECQTDLLALLDANRKIGLTLTDSFLMVPTKSVSAIVGIDLISDEKTPI